MGTKDDGGRRRHGLRMGLKDSGDTLVVARHLKVFGVGALVALLLGAVLVPVVPVALHDVEVIREFWGW